MTLRDLLNASCRHDRYARNDELGVPFAVTFDFETMEAGPGGREMHDLVVWLLKERHDAPQGFGRFWFHIRCISPEIPTLQ